MSLTDPIGTAKRLVESGIDEIKRGVQATATAAGEVVSGIGEIIGLGESSLPPAPAEAKKEVGVPKEVPCFSVNETESAVIFSALPNQKFISDEAVVSEIGTALKAAAAVPGKELIVDLKGLTHICSHFLGIMIEASNEVKKKDRNLRLKLINVNGNIGEVLAVTKLNRVFHVIAENPASSNAKSQ